MKGRLLYWIINLFNMKFFAISKFLLIIIMPFLLFLLVLNFYGFDTSFYKEKFLEYNVQRNVPNAGSLNEKVLNFLKGKDNTLPNEFNEREKQHLLDVKSLITISTFVLYFLIATFILLLLISALTLKINNYILNFVGKVLVFGGILTIMLATTLFLLISSDFSPTFESFHLLFFKRGTYVFEPAKEIIVKLYPEQIFMDLGIKISKLVVMTSFIFILLGLFLLLKSKKNKNRRT